MTMNDTRKLLLACKDLFEQVADAIEGHVDVLDDEGGCRTPNWAMSLTQDIDDLLPRITRAIEAEATHAP